MRSSSGKSSRSSPNVFSIPFRLFSTGLPGSGLPTSGRHDREPHSARCICVTLRDGKRVVQVEQRNGSDSSGVPAILAAQEMTDDRNGSIYLRIEARGGSYDFSYATKEGNWLPLKKDADGTILSTKVSRGFVGAVFGLYAYTPAN